MDAFRLLATLMVAAPPQILPTDAVSLKKEVARHRGQVVLINFWATWCPPCRAEFPALVAAQKKFARQGVALITVAFDTKTAVTQQVAPFLQKHGVTRGAFVNRQGDVPDGGYFQWLEARPPDDLGIPRTYILDRSGQVAARLIGEQSAAQFEEAIRAALARR